MEKLYLFVFIFSLTEHTNGDGDYTSSLLGILVMQDVHLGLLVALLPALAGRRGAASAKVNSGHGNANSSGTNLYVTKSSCVCFAENCFC